MNIIEAIKSGKKFRRPGHAHWFYIGKNQDYIEYQTDYGNRRYNVTLNDIFADNWEIEEEKIEITKTQFANFIYTPVGMKEFLDTSELTQEQYVERAWNKLKGAK